LFFQIYSLNVTKLLTVPMTITMGVSVALIPHLSEAYAQRDLKTIQTLVTQILENVITIFIPVIFLMMAVSKHTFNVISPGSNVAYGAYIFVVFGLYSMVNTFSIVVDNIMLSLAQRKRILVFASCATLIKLLSVYALISWFGIYGLLFSSVISISFAIICNLSVLHNRFKIPLSGFLRKLFYVLICSSIMFIIILPLSSFLFFDSYLINFIMTGILYTLGIIIYLLLALKFNVVDERIKKRLRGKLGFIK
ncbi:MAG: polysaccharide biosynthesis C-terminal domain-containing protein, partial [Bacilli bacterium]